MIRVGLIGAGTMGRVHAAAYRQLEAAHLAMICDRVVEKGHQLAGTGVRAVQDYREVLENPNIDLVDVCLPTYLHREVVTAAAAAGKHVFCEKPIALSVEDAQEMMQICQKAGVKLGIGHVVRFFPDYSKAKVLVESGRVGDPKVVRTSRGGSFPRWSQDNWFADYAKSGGPIVDLIIHDIDWLLWMFGPVKRVFAKSVRKEESKEQLLDHALVTLRFENGIIAHLEGSWAQPEGTPFATSFEIAGTKGLYQYSKKRSTPLLVRTAKGENQAQSVPESPLALDPYTAQLEAFLEAIMEDSEVPVSGLEAARALEVALAARRSADTGEVVHLGGDHNA
ncbi:MAG TPA: Gfo/Idh/MocA family oxidoreductase [Firmicutes bacterium]|jgi:UDP-N-acetylglucosamine 3-dehydrogenase|nr:Gfo/Idh/MocA family oxidoreductase [Bacillota bacterium]